MTMYQGLASLSKVHEGVAQLAIIITGPCCSCFAGRLPVNLIRRSEKLKENHVL
jgi:hypothetical protein